MKTLSFAVSSVAMIALVSCASNVPPPDDENAEAWTPGIQSSYPDWQPPQEMPDGNPAYEEAFGEPRPVDTRAVVVSVSDSSATSEPVQKVDATATVASAGTAKAKETKTQPQVREQKADPKPVEAKPAAPAKFMRVDVFPEETGIEGVYAVNGERVTTSALKTALADAVKTNKDIVVILFGRTNSTVADLNFAVDCCKSAGIEKINVMTNEDIMEQHKADVRAAKGIKDEPAADAGKADAGKADAGKTAEADASKKKTAREKLVVDPDQPSTEYVVKKDDTLSSIAKALYHDGAEWEIIFNANKETLNGKPNYLKVGTKLVIPAVKKVPASSK